MIVELTETQIKLVNIFQSKYKRLVNPDNQDKQILTTIDIFNLMQSLWPSNEYEAMDILVVLEYQNIETIAGDSAFYWLLEPVDA